MRHIKKTAVRCAAAWLIALSVLLVSGCDDLFQPLILTDSETPDMVLNHFFEALKSGQYETCGRYLADNESFIIKDNTEYSIVLPLANKCMEHLDYTFIGECQIDQLTAIRTVRVTALNWNGLVQAIKNNYMPLEYEYLTTHGLKSLDKQKDKQDVGNIICIAIGAYGDSVGIIEHDVTVHFEWEDNQWKIRQETELIRAIFGDDSNA
ncbi:MAG: hypothetical protein II828_08025 [Clostridia bacterium]|nr:hypothetical protein [Clostridia bacterium]